MNQTLKRLRAGFGWVMGWVMRLDERFFSFLLGNHSKNMLDEFMDKWPEKCPICSFHKYGISHGMVPPRTAVQPHDCLEGNSEIAVMPASYSSNGSGKQAAIKMAPTKPPKRHPKRIVLVVILVCIAVNITMIGSSVWFLFRSDLKALHLGALLVANSATYYAVNAFIFNLRGWGGNTFSQGLKWVLFLSFNLCLSAAAVIVSIESQDYSMTLVAAWGAIFSVLLLWKSK